jgi:serine/threonine-protein kinase RsbW/stage II sporulation protein AB (anti-sigma F factor)
VGDARREVTAVARDCGFARVKLNDIKLAVSEAATNVVVHAYASASGEIHVRAGTERHDFVVIIGDDGPGMVPRADSPGLGLGLPMITTVADRVEVVSEGRGCEVHMAFRLPDAR